MFVEITRGRSFQGLAQYCLHDVGAKTRERVAFVETCNLATGNPQVAWRIMAARHYLQNQLKAEHGIRQGGRKDGKPVGHLVLGWRNDEAEAQQLDQEQMIAAARGALRSIGAGQHPAMIVGHTDTEHPHCHVILCLIGEDGRLKKNWKEREQLSRFALDYEIAQHGEPIVKKREENWEHRQAGETPAPVKKKARPLYELEQAARQDQRLEEFAHRHQQQLAKLQREQETRQQRERQNQDRLRWCRDERIRRTRRETAQQVRENRTRIRKAASQPWQELLNEQEADRCEFERRENTLRGSVKNALQLIDWQSLLGKSREAQPQALSQAFGILTSEGVRRQELQKRQQAEKERLRSAQREQEAQQISELRQREARLIQQYREAYVRKVRLMQARQEQRRQELEQQQSQLTAERNQRLTKYREQETLKKQERALAAKEQQQTGKQRTRRERQPRQPRAPRRERTRPQDVVVQGQTQPQQAARQIDQAQDEFERRMREDLHCRRRERDRDDHEH